ncbi:hypothetical protein [Pseudomonas taeanensis]|uniref:hypothetical protein n=1 Tax=Pseudomonas taeanensis TaxID=574962 RepID=UPI000468EF35|nr:hypothetical protein [Pseudomonas taeanensis]
MALPYATLVAVALAAGAIAGCASTHDYLIAQGYPPAFADGYQHGCNSGHQAAGAISGNFHKDVPRYLRETQYATGWDDGFRQCQAMQESSERQAWHEERQDEHEEAWQREKDRAWGKAMHTP